MELTCWKNGCPLDVIARVPDHNNLDITAHYAQVSTRPHDADLQRGPYA
jgi:hypothetical protein